MSRLTNPALFLLNSEVKANLKKGSENVIKQSKELISLIEQMREMHINNILFNPGDAAIQFVYLKGMEELLWLITNQLQILKGSFYSHENYTDDYITDKLNIKSDLIKLFTSIDSKIKRIPKGDKSEQRS